MLRYLVPLLAVALVAFAQQQDATSALQSQQERISNLTDKTAQTLGQQEELQRKIESNANRIGDRVSELESRLNQAQSLGAVNLPQSENNGQDQQSQQQQGGFNGQQQGSFNGQQQGGFNGVQPSGYDGAQMSSGFDGQQQQMRTEQYPDHGQESGSDGYDSAPQFASGFAFPNTPDAQARESFERTNFNNARAGEQFQHGIDEANAPFAQNFVGSQMPSGTFGAEQEATSEAKTPCDFLKGPLYREYQHEHAFSQPFDGIEHTTGVRTHHTPGYIDVPAVKRIPVQRITQSRIIYKPIRQEVQSRLLEPNEALGQVRVLGSIADGRIVDSGLPQLGEVREEDYFLPGGRIRPASADFNAPIPPPPKVAAPAPAPMSPPPASMQTSASSSGSSSFGTESSGYDSASAPAAAPAPSPPKTTAPPPTESAALAYDAPPAPRPAMPMKMRTSREDTSSRDGWQTTGRSFGWADRKNFGNENRRSSAPVGRDTYSRYSSMPSSYSSASSSSGSGSGQYVPTQWRPASTWRRYGSSSSMPARGQSGTMRRFAYSAPVYTPTARNQQATFGMKRRS